jgi:hypothetical protein
MADQAAFSPSKRRKGMLKAAAGSRSFSAGAAFGGKVFAAKDKAAQMWDTAFQAERGCLSAANMPRQLTPGMQH